MFFTPALSRLTFVSLGIVAAALCAQTTAPTTGTAPASSSAASLPATAPAPTNPQVIAILDRLEKLGSTLKDFTAVLDYEVNHIQTDEKEGKDGTVSYVKDLATGEVKFEFIFTTSKLDGKIKKRGLKNQYLFDGRNFFDIDHVAKIYKQVQLVKPGDPPENVLKIGGPVPLPLGQKTAVILADFDASLIQPAAAGAPADTLKLVPKKKGKFDFTELSITLDPQTDLPSEIRSTNVNEDVTTIKMISPVINSGKATIPIPVTPKTGDGWAVEIKPLSP